MLTSTQDKYKYYLDISPCMFTDTSDLLKAVRFNCSNSSEINGILDLSDFSNLREINCSNTNVTGVVLNNLHRLEILRISNTKITFLDVSNSWKLKEIYCHNVELINISELILNTNILVMR